MSPTVPFGFAAVSALSLASALSSAWRVGEAPVFFGYMERCERWRVFWLHGDVFFGYVASLERRRFWLREQKLASRREE